MHKNKLARAELILPFGMYSKIEDYLFEDISKEYLCYLLCGHAFIGNKLKLLGCYLIIPEESDIESNSLISVRIKKEFLTNILKECERLNLSLIDIHSHPFTSKGVSFSSIDDQDESEKATWFAKNLPQCFFGSIVMGTESHDARIYLRNDRVIGKQLFIKSLELPIRTNRKNENFNSKIFDRQIRAFGIDGQKRLANVCVGIVGLGGLGAGIAIQLARLGVKNFRLYDPDRSDETNLNRVEGMTRMDCKLKNYKVDITVRNILSIDEKINCKTIKKDITAQNNWRSIRDVDLIITATDNHKSRMFLNLISQQYLIPQISIGTLISTDKNELDGAHGHIYTIIPGHNQPCALCAEIINPTEVYYEIASKNSRQKAFDAGYIENFKEPTPAVTHLNGVIINLALVEIHNLFCNFKEFTRHIVFSLLDQEIYTISETPRNCASCSEGGGIFGRGDSIGSPMKDIVSAF